MYLGTSSTGRMERHRWKRKKCDLTKTQSVLSQIHHFEGGTSIQTTSHLCMMDGTKIITLASEDIPKKGYRGKMHQMKHKVCAFGVFFRLKLMELHIMGHLTYSVTRWLDYYLVFGHLGQLNFAELREKR